MTRAILPTAVALTALGCSSFGFWFLAQLRWALKSKYLLFLFPAYVVFVLEGLAEVLMGISLN